MTALVSTSATKRWVKRAAKASGSAAERWAKKAAEVTGAQKRPILAGAVLTPLVLGFVARQRSLAAQRRSRTGALALGAIAGGALALGAVSIGALAIGRLAIRNMRISRLRIDHLEVRETVSPDPQSPATG